MSASSRKPLVVITGAAGDIGSSLAAALAPGYTVVGLDREQGGEGDGAIITADLTSDESVGNALQQVRERHGDHIASVVHLAAYFDFTGEENPLYDQVNVEGTRRLLRALRELEVEQFVYASTMLVHRPGRPGDVIDESTPLDPRWAYPRSKALTEQVIREEHGDIPYVLLRLAGLYDDQSCVPTLAHQMSRVYERDAQSRLFPGDASAGQAFLHRDDMIDAFRRAIDRRGALPQDAAILAGEPDAVSFEELQNLIGALIHGAKEWETMSIPPALARAGAWLQSKAEPLIPDTIDRGRPPFIRPFMIEMAQDHYALDISRAREWLGWTPQHAIRSTLPHIIDALKRDPAAWYDAHKLTPPEWLESAADAKQNAERVREARETQYRAALRENRWAHFANMGLATWLITAPVLVGYQSTLLTWSDVASGVVLLVFALLSLSWRSGWARWVCAAIGVWLLFAPVFLWAPTAGAYLNDTLIGTLVIGFAVLTRPAHGVSAAAAILGPIIPPGWDFSPSSWFQRLPIIVLAFIGLHISRYLAAYQLGHLDGVWEPFFAGGSDPKNGTEEIITSSLSRAWPVSDAGVGAVTYALEILTGVIGSARRWRTMPWLVILFGLMIVPLGVISLLFIIIQPILIGAWCTLCLIAAAAMLIQIPFSLDELLATGQFLLRRKRAGKSLLSVFFMGDTDETTGGRPQPDTDEFARPPGEIVRESLSGGVGAPWNLLASIAVGVWLLFTRVTLGAEADMANSDHVIGSLAITVAVIALAEIARPVRFLNMALGLALLITPFVFDAAAPSMISSIACGVALILLSIRRGSIRCHYGRWNRLRI
ncbi:MAG: NAD-dependent epimerase/dehydratase family protein [Steroidobacter sp.]